MKKCTRCQTPKLESEFAIRDKNTGRLHSYCKSCKKEIDKSAYHENRWSRKTKLRAWAIERITKARIFVKRVKRFARCKKCGDKRWYVLDFHHVRGKNYNIGELASRGCTLKKLKEELKKCDILCANCHREEHYLKGDEANLVEASD